MHRLIKLFSLKAVTGISCSLLLISCLINLQNCTLETKGQPTTAVAFDAPIPYTISTWNCMDIQWDTYDYTVCPLQFKMIQSDQKVQYRYTVTRRFAQSLETRLLEIKVTQGPPIQKIIEAFLKQPTGNLSIDFTGWILSSELSLVPISGVAYRNGYMTDQQLDKYVSKPKEILAVGANSPKRCYDWLMTTTDRSTGVVASNQQLYTVCYQQDQLEVGQAHPLTATKSLGECNYDIPLVAITRPSFQQQLAATDPHSISWINGIQEQTCQLKARVAYEGYCTWDHQLYLEGLTNSLPCTCIDVKHIPDGGPAFNNAPRTIKSGLIINYGNISPFDLFKAEPIATDSILVSDFSVREMGLVKKDVFHVFAETDVCFPHCEIRAQERARKREERRKAREKKEKKG